MANAASASRARAASARSSLIDDWMLLNSVMTTRATMLRMVPPNTRQKTEIFSSSFSLCAGRASGADAERSVSLASGVFSSCDCSSSWA